jgi:flagellar protein FlbD
VIRLTRLNGDPFALNPDLIERIDAHPDTVIALVDDTRYVVTENVDEVLDRIKQFRAEILALAHQIERDAAAGQGPNLTVVPTSKKEN